ncbi:MAG TPA: type III-B CRISPR-associated protein Cas10/Cmr2 [Thermoanaerobaculia bacterium]|nr:type III-B CRISPR-associated protein Cas10/Cmr2 [Thermoanaerobaculia bacterium]
MAHVLILTLGPIQDFIISARRARDLWFGSWLLSELSRAVAQSVSRTCGEGALVFPGADSEGLKNDATSVANKIVARVPDGLDPGAVAAQAETDLRTKLIGFANAAFDKIHDGEIGEFFKRPRAWDQVMDLIEFSWVSAPEASPEAYAEARLQAEALLAARKNTRLWQGVTWGDAVPKSSLDGERESVLGEELFDLAKDKKVSPEKLRRLYGVNRTERLCGVGLLKRHGERKSKRYGHRFVSTGHIAAWPLLERMAKMGDDEELRDAWSRYVAVLEELEVDLKDQEASLPDFRHKVIGPYDGSLLFENRLPDLFEDLLDRDKWEEKKEIRRRSQEARKALLPVLARAGVPQPLPYYAILQADGDHMGKAILNQTRLEQHKELSRALDRFARNTRRIVEHDHKGELIYAGGDDVLAFVPLHLAVACAKALAEDFKEQLKAFPAVGTEPPTLSAGIGISHFLEPMGTALNTARKAEKLAKKKRNSLAVILDKRSGPPTEVTGHWGKLDQELLDFTELHRKEQISDRAAFELRELEILTKGLDGEALESLQALARSEAERILRRKQPAEGVDSKIDPEILDRLIKRLDVLKPRELGDRLIVARLLAKAADEAELPKKDEAQEVAA